MHAKTTSGFARQRSLLLPLCFLTMLAAGLWAQEGHPLAGSWHGSWGPDAKTQTNITIVLEYDGRNITGLINPGAESARLTKATLDPDSWSVHFEADLKDRSGAISHATIDGRIENLTSARRFITGTWVQGSARGTFKITRDD